MAILLSDRIKLLKKIIQIVLDKKRLGYLLNHTFIRNVKLGNYLTKRSICNLIPFNTNLIIIKDKEIQFKKFIDSIPSDIIKISLVTNTRNNNSLFLTTDYLFQNFYPRKSETILQSLNVRDIILRKII